jgi:hypothetical protein
MARDNRLLAQCELAGIGPSPRGVPQIEVTFEVTAAGLVRVSAKDLGSGRTQAVRVARGPGFTQDEVDRITGAAEARLRQDERSGALTVIHLKVWVFRNGAIELDGQRVSLERLDTDLGELARQKGVLLYGRDDADKDPHPIAKRVMELVVKHHLPIGLSTKRDFSDVVDAEGRMALP